MPTIFSLAKIKIPVFNLMIIHSNIPQKQGLLNPTINFLNPSYAQPFPISRLSWHYISQVVVCCLSMSSSNFQFTLSFFFSLLYYDLLH